MFAETDPIKFNLYRLVNRALNATYRRDLVKYKRHCLRVHSPFVLNLLLTHRPLFVATLALLDGLTEDNVRTSSLDHLYPLTD